VWHRRFGVRGIYVNTSSDPFSNLPRWLAIVVGGIGFVIGFTQPLWVAIVYIAALIIAGVVFVKVQQSRSK
jgi:hypothetical protein